MSELKQPKEQNQIRALEIYLESATFDNEYKPLSRVKIAEQLNAEGFDGSKSSVDRWIKDFGFESHLQLKVQSSFTKDKDISKTTEALRKTVETDLVSVARNKELMSSAYEVMELFTDRVLATAQTDVNRVRRDDVKLVKDIALLTAGREDKMLDRLALAGHERVSSKELKAEFEMIDIEVE